MEKNEFLQLVQEAEILINLSEASSPALTKRGLVMGVQGETVVEGETLSMVVGISSQFPLLHPVFFLVNKEEYLLLPHVEEDGYICYTRQDDIVLDIENPVGIIRDCFAMAKTTLHNGLSGKNRDDFYNEYEAYWRQLKNDIPVFTNIAISDEVGVIRYAKFKSKNALFAFTDEKERSQTFVNLFDSEKELPPTYTGIFIPLRAGSKVLIPSGSMRLASSHLQALIAHNLTCVNEKRLELILRQTKREDLLIFCLPQPNGYYSLFGVRLKMINYKKHPLLSVTTPVTFEPLSVTRVDPEYLFARGARVGVI